MRSSIACSRCRKSKIKCSNTGTSNACMACQIAGKECLYPSTAQGVSSTPKRVEPVSTSVKSEGDGEVKRVKKKECEAVRKPSLKDEVGVFDTPQITENMWHAIYTAFALHFSNELPFLEANHFMDVQVPAAATNADVQDLLLGVLALTARFIPELVSHHAGPNNDVMLASEFYADALAQRLNATSMCTPSVERCQALLMLSLYNWGMCRGTTAWVFSGLAISMAELLGLFREEKGSGASDPRRSALPEDILRQEQERLGVKPTASTTLPEEEENIFRDREIKRRTIYSAFMVDKFLASGEDRRERIRIDQIKVQLPCSDEDFRFGSDARTGRLTHDGIQLYDHGRLDSSQVLSIYIYLVDIFGRFMRWSCNGGRREEQLPPWDERSTYHRLKGDLDRFQASLPSKLVLSETNTKAHISGPHTTAYAALHTLYSLCRIVLHREYIPFVALKCDRPVGPLDAPLLPKEQTPPRFWEECTQQIFKAARDISSIVGATKRRGKLVESPQMAFAIWQAAYIGIYSINFPHMDEKRYMSDVPHATRIDADEMQWKGSTGLAVRTLKEMTPRLKMAQGWFRTIKRMFSYYVDMRAEYSRAISRSTNEGTASAAAALNSLRQGGSGGGLEEFKIIERELKDFGNLDDDRRSATVNTDAYDSYKIDNLATSRELDRHVLPRTHKSPLQSINRGSHSWSAVNNGTVQPKLEDPGRSMSSYDHATQQAAQALTHSASSYYQASRGSTSAPPHLLSPASTPAGSSTPPYPYRSNEPSYQATNHLQHSSKSNMAQHTSWPSQSHGSNGHSYASTLDRDIQTVLQTVRDVEQFSLGIFDMYAFGTGEPLDMNLDINEAGRELLVNGTGGSGLVGANSGDAGRQSSANEASSRESGFGTQSMQDFPYALQYDRVDAAFGAHPDSKPSSMSASNSMSRSDPLPNQTVDDTLPGISPYNSNDNGYNTGIGKKGVDWW